MFPVLFKLLQIIFGFIYRTLKAHFRNRFIIFPSLVRVLYSYRDTLYLALNNSFVKNKIRQITIADPDQHDQ